MNHKIYVMMIDLYGNSVTLYKMNVVYYICIKYIIIEIRLSILFNNYIYMQVGEQYIDLHGRNLKYIGLNNSKNKYVFEWINSLGQRKRIQSGIGSQHHHYTLLAHNDPNYNNDTDDEYLTGDDETGGGTKRKSTKRKSTKRKSTKRKSTKRKSIKSRR